MSKGYKGGDFEREICKKLSLWWSAPNQRDDIYWRSSQSGGRATQRMKSGKSTYGSYGDIAAIDPIGEPLLKVMTLELKRGSSHSHAGDLLDFKSDNGAHPWSNCLKQARASHLQAKSAGWAIIARRDHRRAIIYIEADLARLLREEAGAKIFTCPPYVRYKLKIVEGDWPRTYHFVGMHLDCFLARVTPEQIIRLAKKLT